MNIHMILRSEFYPGWLSGSYDMNRSQFHSCRRSVCHRLNVAASVKISEVENKRFLELNGYARLFRRGMSVSLYNRQNSDDAAHPVRCVRLMLTHAFRLLLFRKDRCPVFFFLQPEVTFRRQKLK